jgi:hypothetical protein
MGGENNIQEEKKIKWSFKKRISRYNGIWNCMANHDLALTLHVRGCSRICMAKMALWTCMPRTCMMLCFLIILCD